MKANNSTLKMMVLVAVTAMAFFSVTAGAFAKAASTVTLESAKQQEMEAVKPAGESVVGQDFEVRAMEAIDISELQVAEDPADEQVAKPDEFEDLPAGSEGDAGDPEDEATVPETHETKPSAEPTQPPILVVSTTPSHEATPTYIPHRDHLAFTGGAEVAYLLSGALIIAAAAGILILGRSQKQGQRQ